MDRKILTISDHNRSFQGLTYVYPVVSRRSHGVSLGINLSPNNACNWRCIYCQVPNLIRGVPPVIDLRLLRHELDHMLNWILYSDFMIQHVPIELRRLNDICLSGNGEPTLSAQLLPVINIINEMRKTYNLDKAAIVANKVKTLLITNGSQIKKSHVKECLSLLQAHDGEVWFKLDSANSQKILQINQVNLNASQIIEQLAACAQLCPTYIQTCVFKNKGINSLSSDNLAEYLQIIAQFKDKINGVLLYSIARQPALTQGAGLESVDLSYLIDLARQIQALGVNVSYYL